MGGRRLGKLLGRFSMKRIVSARYFPIKTTGGFCEEQKKTLQRMSSTDIQPAQLDSTWGPMRQTTAPKKVCWNIYLSFSGEKSRAWSIFRRSFLWILFSLNSFLLKFFSLRKYSNRPKQYDYDFLHNATPTVSTTITLPVAKIMHAAPFAHSNRNDPIPRLRGTLSKKKLKSILIVFLFSSFVLLLLAVYF